MKTKVKWSERNKGKEMTRSLARSTTRDGMSDCQLADPTVWVRR
jgi:hypothetical protein